MAIPGLTAGNLDLGPSNAYFGGTALGFLGENTRLRVNYTSTNLTGAQTGTVAQDTVLTGGTTEIELPLKEITLENLAIAFPSGDLVGNLLTVKAKVGFKLRSIAQELKLVRIDGDTETVDPKRIFVVPLASPAPQTTELIFHPTNQIEATIRFYAWPDNTTGEWWHLGS